MPTWLIWLIVIVVVVVLAALVVSLAVRRRTERRRARAEQLRQDATAQASGLAESERVEEQAETAEQGHQAEQAGYEDKLREADRLDPEVDTRATGYEPNVWDDERSETEPTSTGEPAPGPSPGPPDTPRHAADTETPPTAPSEESAGASEEAHRRGPA